MHDPQHHQPTDDPSPSTPKLDRPNRIPWPPVLDALVLLAAVGLQRLWPLPAVLPAGTLRWFGWLLCAAGVAVAGAGIARFRRAGTPVDPTARARALATDGIYAYTRNPMYLGTLGAFAGLGLAWPSTWLLVLLPLLAIGLVKLAIMREEAYLERRFGATYRAYRSRVRRWL